MCEKCPFFLGAKREKNSACPCKKIDCDGILDYNQLLRNILETFDYNCPYGCGAVNMSLKNLINHALKFECKRLSEFEKATINQLTEKIGRL